MWAIELAGVPIRGSRAEGADRRHALRNGPSLGRFAGATAAGAVVTTLGDLAHTQTKTLVHGTQHLLGQPIWEYPMFLASGAVTLGLGALLLEKFPSDAERPGDGELAKTAGIYGGGYLASALLHERPALVAGGLTALFGYQLLENEDRTPAHFILPAAMAIAGPLLEHRAASSGSMAYRAPGLGKVPIWLPALYLLAGYATVELARWVGFGSKND